MEIVMWVFASWFESVVTSSDNNSKQWFYYQSRDESAFFTEYIGELCSDFFLLHYASIAVKPS